MAGRAETGLRPGCGSGFFKFAGFGPTRPAAGRAPAVPTGHRQPSRGRQHPGGDYAAAGGNYTFRSGSLADLSITKIGGGGEVASPSPLGLGSLQWAPVLQGNLGMVSAVNTFETGYLAGNRMTYDTLAIAAGGGVAIYFTKHLSLSPTLSGMYGRVQNKFDAQNAIGDFVKSVGSGTLV